MRSLFECFHIVFFLRLRPKRIPGNSFILYVFLCSLSLSFYFSAKMLRNLLELVGVATDLWRCGRGIAKWECVTTHQNDTENHSH